MDDDIEVDLEDVAVEDQVDRSKPLLWVDRYTPQRYTELLSDEVCFAVLYPES